MNLNNVIVYVVCLLTDTSLNLQEVTELIKDPSNLLMFAFMRNKCE